MRAIVVLIFTPLVVGAKCIPYDPVFDVSQSQGDVQSSPGDAVLPPPAVACDEENEARLRVREFEFSIICGCVEIPWSDAEQSRTCTVPVGTTIVWGFAGSEEHNVSTGDFESSADRLFGQHTTVFDRAGTFAYNCSLHPSTMSGYRIVVR